MNTTDPTVEATNTVSLANEEEVKQVLLKSVLGLWDQLRAGRYRWSRGTAPQWIHTDVS